MRLDEIQESQNIDDRSGQGGGGGMGRGFPGGRGSLGFGTIALLTVVGWALGINPAILIGGAEIISGSGGGGQTISRQNVPPRSASAEEEKLRVELSKVFNANEIIWAEILPQQTNRPYRAPRPLVRFRNRTESACGSAQAAMGPFYCPGDERIYIDLSFYEEMRTKLRADGDFARAYVIAHEMGHHIENVMGILPKVQQMQQRVSRKEANALSVRVELMADCLAGVWAHHANKKWRLMEPGDLEEALTAAAAIGDDKLQKQSQGYVIPDSFTHGTSEQRSRWLQQGLRTGQVNSCDTFKSVAL